MKRNENGILENHLSANIPVCTDCGKCSVVCPAKIDILEALRIYEKYCAGDLEAADQMNEMDSSGKPIDCIECGACSAHCPNRIEVRKIVRTLAMMQSSQTHILCSRAYKIIDGR